MKAILLAAGMGTRLSRDLPGIPKCIVDIHGQTLLENTIRKLRNQSVHEISVVVGYQAKRIMETVRHEKVRFFANPFYDKTNSIASLWFARDFLDDDDFLILNADVFLEEEILEQAIREPITPVLFADPSRKREADYKLSYKNHILLDHGKELPESAITGEYIGIARIGQRFVPVFKERLEALIHSQQHGLWWENVLYSMIGETSVYVSEIPAGVFWAEVDTVSDYNRILAHFAAKGAGTYEADRYLGSITGL